MKESSAATWPTANGLRLAIKGKRGAGEIILNGAVAHLGKKGDLLTIMSFASISKKKAKGWKPRVVVLGKNNCVVAIKRGV